MFESGREAGFFKWHTKPITSVQWHPTEEAILAVSSEDDTVTVWDMSVELDDDAAQTGDAAAPDEMAVPPQLLFVHCGQKEVKEVHFHPQIPSMIASTSITGFNFFKPANL